jgi:hypothetical protein
MVCQIVRQLAIRKFLTRSNSLTGTPYMFRFILSPCRLQSGPWPQSCAPLQLMSSHGPYPSWHALHVP